MSRRFGSVRAKFTMLVGLPVLLVLAVSPSHFEADGATEAPVMTYEVLAIKGEPS
jgi:hypothetical protein